ncbi:MAG: zinc metallopeptidase [Anaerolineae bacterium]|nr:MAG: zinc metallopeptidase [Anaerolineae bacterium]
MYWFNPLYLVFALPGLLLALWAQAKVKSAFNKYSRIGTRTGISGAEAARRVLDANGLYDVDIQPVQGFLSDHYDPRSRVLRLSPEVYRGTSLASVGVAAHEAGHALQDAKNYLPLQARTAIVPAVQFGSWLGPIIFGAGFFMAYLTGGRFGYSVAWLGVLLFGLTALFALITLPVEFDASRRAKAVLTQLGIVSHQEITGVARVLDAAALTYVAAAVQAIGTLLYYVYLLSGSRRR